MMTATRTLLGALFFMGTASFASDAILMVANYKIGLNPGIF
jgi:hypothetical protein